MSRWTEAATACQPEPTPDATPTENDIRAYYATLGFFVPGAEWNPDAGQYEADAP